MEEKTLEFSEFNLLNWWAHVIEHAHNGWFSLGKLMMIKLPNSPPSESACVIVTRLVMAYPISTVLCCSNEFS